MLLIGFLFVLNTFSQEKKIWAKSFINQKAPNLVVEKWLSEQPETTRKFILIDFWATWCPACRTIIPKLNQFKKEFENDLIVIGISFETKRKIEKFTGPKIEYYSAIDTRRKSYKSLKIDGVPHCIIIDPSGIVCWEGDPLSEGFELTSEVIQDIIQNYRAPKTIEQNN